MVDLTEDVELPEHIKAKAMECFAHFSDDVRVPATSLVLTYISRALLAVYWEGYREGGNDREAELG